MSPPIIISRRLRQFASARVLSHLVVLAVCALWTTSAAAQRDESFDRFTLLTRNLEAHNVQLIEISPNAVHVRDDSGALKRLPRAEVLGLINPDARLAPNTDMGEVILADGQRLPGTPLQRSVSDNTALLWLHQRLRQVAIPIESLRTVRLISTARLPAPGLADVLLLTNGDRVEGFITGISDVITLDVNGTETTVPIDRVNSMRLVAMGEQARSDAVRLWLADGTVLDVTQVAMGDDGIVRLEKPMLVPEIAQLFHSLKDVAGILFEPDLLIPLASLDEPSVTGPPTRYVTPSPKVLDEVAPLGLARLRLDGPLTARWRVPEGVTGFAAEAALPEEAMNWGHCELIVLDDDREVFRATLDRATPRARIQVPLTGSELTVRIEEGQYGPILDRVVLERAGLLRAPR